MIKKLRLATLSASVMLIPFFAFVPKSFAGSGVIYISPSSTSVYQGNSVTVSLRINPGTAVDSVQATVNYDPSLLQFDSTAIGTFSTCTQNSGGGGSVALSCAIMGSATSSDSLIANITFTALAGSGTSGLNVTGANAAYQGAYTNPASGNGSISLSTPPPAPTSSHSSYHYSGYTSSASSGSTAATTATPSPTPAAPPPKAKVSLSLGKVQFTGAAFTVSADESVQSLIKYGTDKNNLNQSSALSSPGTKVSVSLPDSSLAPGTTYYYQAEAQISGTVVGQSPVYSFTTKGFSLNIAVLDSKYRPLVNKMVTLHSNVQKAVTNSQGVAVFTDIAPGYHHIEYTIGNKTYTQAVYVANNMTENGGIQSAPMQTDAVILPGLVQPRNFLAFSITLSAVLIVVLALLLFIFRRSVLLSRTLAHIERFLLHIKRGRFAQI